MGALTYLVESVGGSRIAWMGMRRGWCHSVGDQFGVRLGAVQTKRVQGGQNVWEVYAAVGQISKSQSEGKEQAGQPTVAVLWGWIEPLAVRYLGLVMDW